MRKKTVTKHTLSFFLISISDLASKWGFNLGRLVGKVMVMVETKIVNEFVNFEF